MKVQGITELSNEVNCVMTLNTTNNPFHQVSQNSKSKRDSLSIRLQFKSIRYEYRCEGKGIQPHANLLTTSTMVWPASSNCGCDEGVLVRTVYL